VHPLAGQGLNLGLADVAALVRVLQTRERWRSLADLRLLRRYERQRSSAVAGAQLAMDGLQQLFTRADTPLPSLRHCGMNLFDRCTPLKGWVSRRAMGVA
ncbi:MAG: ubiquinone biosynthesis protein UbiH, partial [Comamonas sp.]